MTIYREFFKVVLNKSVIQLGKNQLIIHGGKNPR